MQTDELLLLDLAKLNVMERALVDFGPGRYVVVDDEVFDTDFAWYIPFTSLDVAEGPPVIGGGGGPNAYLVSKATGDMVKAVGHRASLEDQFLGFEFGIAIGHYDLVISAVRNMEATVEIVDSIGLQYHHPETEHGRTYRISKRFSREMIASRLDTLPATFRNQQLSMRGRHFEQLRDANCCDFSFTRVVDKDAFASGEALEWD